MKSASAKKNCHTAIKLSLAGAIASSINLPLPAAAQTEITSSGIESTLTLTTIQTANPSAEIIAPRKLTPVASSELNTTSVSQSLQIELQEVALPIADQISSEEIVPGAEQNSTEQVQSDGAEQNSTEQVQSDSISTELSPTQDEMGVNDASLDSPVLIPESVPSTSDRPVDESNIDRVPDSVSDSTEGNIEVSTDSLDGGSNTSFRVLSPAPETVLDVPATTIILQYSIGSQVTLQINGSDVDSSLIGRTETDSSTNLITQTWYGVGLREGKNTITAQVTANGTSTDTVSLDVVVRGAPTQLTVETVEPEVPADGRSTVTVRGELLDENGNRSSQDGVITLEASDGRFVGADYDTDQPGFQVQARQGQYTATLQSSLEAGVVRIRAVSGALEAFNQVEFQTSLHPVLVSGVVDLRLGPRGTDFFGSFRDFLPLDGDNSNEVDLDGAVFATFPIGEWQFTGAYNTDRPLNQTCNDETNLFRRQENCDQIYPVYGDSSTSDILTPSTDQVYLRLERTSPVRGAGSDFIMWGDYSTADEFATRSQFFTATSRELHGLYANYNLGDLRVTGFYGNNVQGFQRDTIAPDGTSGYYFLSRRLLIPGSENVFIETEEFNRPGTVLETEQLTRGIDYQIEYDRGTLLFNQPILKTGVSEQGQVLVRRIVVTYQYENDTNADIYGGRLQYNFSRTLNEESWLGATYVRENQGNRQFELYGADALVSLGSTGEIIAEYAHSRNNSDLLGSVSGSAYRLEVQGSLFDDLLQGRAYYRSTDPGFTNNATTSFVPGQTRYGAEVQARLSPSTNLRASYDHEDNFGVAPRQLDDLFDLLNPGSEPQPGEPVDNSLTTITVGAEQRIGEATVGLDWIHRDRQDRIRPDLSGTSNQLRSRLTLPIFDDLTFRAQNELNLSGNDPLYPNRTILGLDWQVRPGITLSLNHQFFSGTESEDNSITSLDLNGDYNLTPDTRISGRLSLIRDHGLAGSIGINQGITLAPGLRATLAYEHIFGNEFNYTGAGTQFPQAYAVGQSASSLGVESGDSYSVGLEYTDNPNFQANARFEHRTSSSGSNTTITAAALGRITPSLTALFNFQQASAANQTLSGLGTSSTLRLGLAYRNPADDRFNALLRYEYRRNPSIIPDDLLVGSGTGSVEHLFAAEAIYAPNWRWEFYGKFALRHNTSYLASDLLGTSTVTLAQARATYRFNYRWDIAAEARWISQPTANYDETGFSLEAGYYLSPNLRLSAGYSFGNVNDRDLNNSRSASGPYLGVTLKLDNNLFRDFGVRNTAPRQQQESAVDSATDDSNEDSNSAPLMLAPLDSSSSPTP